MRNALHFLVSLIQFAIMGFALSFFFGGVQWLISLTSLVNPPSWHKVLWGGVTLFAVIFVYSSFKTLQTMYHAHKDPVFRDAIACRIVDNWDAYKRLKESGREKSPKINKSNAR